MVYKYLTRGKLQPPLFNPRLRRQTGRCSDNGEKKSRTKERGKWLTVITRFRAPRIARRAQKPKDGRRDEGAEHAVSELSRGFISEPYRKQTLSCGDNGGTASSSPFCHRSSHPPCLPTIKPCFLSDLSTDVPMVLINEKLHLRVSLAFLSPESKNGPSRPTTLTVPKVSCQMDDREQLKMTIVLRGSRYCRLVHRDHVLCDETMLL